MAKTGWKRSLGTSKREQGIITPPQPRRVSCGCWLKGKVLWQMCLMHQQQINRLMADAQQKEEEKKDEKKPTPPPQPWVENTNVTEDVAVRLT